MNEPLKYLIDNLQDLVEKTNFNTEFDYLSEEDRDKTRAKLQEALEFICSNTYELHSRPYPYSFKVAKRIVTEMQVIREWKKIKNSRALNREAKILYIADTLELTRKNVRDCIERVKNGDGFGFYFTEVKV